MNKVIECACGNGACHASVTVHVNDGTAYLTMDTETVELSMESILMLQTALLEALIEQTEYHALPSAD